MSPFAQLAFLGTTGVFFKKNKIDLFSTASMKWGLSFLLP